MTGMSPLLLLVALAATANTTPRDAIAAYARATERSDPEALDEAVQPSAVMYCADGADTRATSQGEWKTRLAASVPPTPASTRIDWLDDGKESAVARLTAVRGALRFTDYLLIARLREGWRIVGKLCEAGVDDSIPPATAAAERVIDAKLAADRAWNGALLADSIDARALVMTVENGEFVAATLAEWQARYVERRKHSPGNAVTVTSRQTDVRGSIGAARWTFHSPSGSDWSDRALIMRRPDGRWRMMALLFVQDAPAD